MSATTSRTLEDRMAGIKRMIRALDRDLAEWEPDDLIILADLEAELRRVRGAAVLGMREHGITDKQIGDALNITQQAVSKRWPGGGRYVGAAGRYRKQPGDTNEPARTT